MVVYMDRVRHLRSGSSLRVMFVGAVATAIVIETHSTAGLADLATLVLSVSAVVLPLATRRRGRRKRQ